MARVVLLTGGNVGDVKERLRTAQRLVNARIGADGKIITAGDQIFLGGNDSYVAMCHKCWRRKIKEQQNS